MRTHATRSGIWAWILMALLLALGPAALAGTHWADSPEFVADAREWAYSPEFTVDTRDAQTIDFPAPPEKTYCDADFAHGATASSGLEVTVTSSDEGVARVAGATVLIVGAGSCTLTATQEGGGPWLPAPLVQRTLVVHPAPLTATADAKSKVYGSANPVFTITYTGLLCGDVAPATPPVAACAATACSGVGEYTITLTGGADPNYALTLVPGTLTVTPAPLVCTADAKSKVYGSPNPVLTISYAGLVCGDPAPAVPPVLVPPDPCLAVGQYPLAPAGGSDPNYVLTLVASTLTVTPAPLVCTADAKSRVYGSANPPLTISYAGLVCGDAAPTTPPAIACAATPASPAGTYPITLAGGADPNYDLTLVAGTLTVGKAGATVTLSDLDPVYDGTAKAATVTTDPPGLAVAITYDGAPAPPVAAGAYAVSATVDDPNWEGTAAGDLVIARRPAAVVADDQVKTYGETDPPLTYTVLVAPVAGDTFSGALTRAPGEDAGTYEITQGTLTLSTNYDLTVTPGTLTIGKATPTMTWSAPAPIVYGTALDGTQLNATANTPGTFLYDPPAGTVLPAGTHTLRVTFTPDDTVNWTGTEATVELTVTPAPLTVRAEDQSRIYGQPNPAFTIAYTGLRNADPAPAIPPTAVCDATPASPAGAYPIALAGGSDPNYVLTLVPGTLTVGQALLTVTAEDQSRLYGDLNPPLTLAYEGFVNDDTPADLDTPPTAACAATPASPVGACPITAGGGADANYAFAYFEGTLTIAPAPLLCTAVHQARAYGQPNPTFTIAYTGLKNADSAPAVPPTPACAATPASPVGTYPITLSGGSDPNYALTLVPGTLTIGQALLTVTAEDQSRLYGDPNPALTVTYAGFVNDDTETDLDTAPTATCMATPASAAGAYPISPGGGADDNYAFAYAEGTLTVTPAPLSCTADDKVRVYGSTNHSLTISYSGLMNADSAPAVPPAASCVADAASPLGTYPITLSGGSDPNYTLTLVDGTLTVVRSVLTVTALDAARLYGAPNPEFAVTITGFVDGEDASVLDEPPTAASAATPASPVGAYDIVPSGGAGANYALVYVKGTLTVTPAPLTCTANDQERLFWTPNPAFTIAYTGLRNADSAPAVPPVATCAAVRASDPGAYPIVLTGGADPNYALTLVNGTLTVTPAVDVPPAGDFELAFVNPVNPAGRRLWDFTGPYEVAVGGYTLQMDLLHTPRGTLSGGGRLAGRMPSGVAIDVPLRLRGKVSGGGGAVSATVTLSGRRSTASVKLRLTLALDAGQLAGAYAGTVSDRGGGKDTIAGPCVLALDPAMDGGFRLAMDLDQNALGAITGLGVLRLSNDREVVVLIKGNEGNGTITLQMSGDPAADPLASRVTLKVTGSTMSNGAMEVLTLSGNAFGQAPRWP